MPHNIALFTGYTNPTPAPSAFAGHKGSSSRTSKFARVARECNSKSSKTARKECWRKHYPKK